MDARRPSWCARARSEWLATSRHRPGQRHDGPCDHDDLGVAEVVFRQSRHEKARHRGNATGHERPLKGASDLEVLQEANGVPIEAEPDREPGGKAQRATLCQDLKRRVVDMSGALLESPGLSELRIHALDAT